MKKNASKLFSSQKRAWSQNFHNILMEKEISTNIVSQKNDSSGDFNEKIKI